MFFLPFTVQNARDKQLDLLMWVCCFDRHVSPLYRIDIITVIVGELVCFSLRISVSVVYKLCPSLKGYVPGVSFKVFRKPLSTEPVNKTSQREVKLFIFPLLKRHNSYIIQQH